MISYAKLWILLEKKNMKKTDLLEVISSPTLTKLGKNENINVSMIEKLCAFLNCQPGDIMEYISPDDMRKTITQMDMSIRAMVENLKAQGITEEQFATMMSEVMPEMMKSMFNGGNVLNDILDKAIEQNEKNQ